MGELRCKRINKERSKEKDRETKWVRERYSERGRDGWGKRERERVRERGEREEYQLGT